MCPLRAEKEDPECGCQSKLEGTPVWDYLLCDRRTYRLAVDRTLGIMTFILAREGSKNAQSMLQPRFLTKLGWVFRNIYKGHMHKTKGG